MTTTLMSPSGTELPAIRPLRFPTLLAVELRKMTDTRSGRGLLAVTLASSVAVLVWKTTQTSIATAFDNYSAGVATMIAFAAPLIGLLAMTSEWTQRTALATFTLVPRRRRVIAAKYVASLVLCLGAMAVGLALAAAACTIGGIVHGPADFSGWAGDVRYAAIFVVLQLTMAAAFGALAANTPIALGAFLLAPTVWAMLTEGALRFVAQWFDIFAAYARLSSDKPLGEIGHTVVAITAWVAVPAAIGLVRSLRRDVK